jgi:serine/threonine protein kinase
MNTTPKHLGKYELRERLGRGGVAEVWKAFDTQLQRFVAIKILQPDLREDPNFVEHFKREAKLIASLHHPNIVQIHDFQVYQPGEADIDQAETLTTSSVTPLAYMVMDYIEGGTLARYIENTSKKGQIPPPTELISIFTSISLAVDYAHQQKMIHRDIKPANILLDAHNTSNNPVGEPILTDFGVAKLLSTSGSTLSNTQLGTPLYISPEQARGYPGNERSDLYSLGVILYEMVTGITPFRGDTPVDVITQHANAIPTAPQLINPNIPPTLNLVIMRSLEKDPAKRFSSAASMTAALAEALNLPVPEQLGQPAYPVDEQDMPTQLTPLPIQSSNPPPATVLTPAGAQPSNPAMSPAYTPGRQSDPTSQPNFTPLLVQATPAAPTTQPTPPAPTMPQPASPPPPQQKRGGLRWLYIALTAAAIIALLAAGVAAFLSFSKPPTAVTGGVTGHAFYVSSGQLNLRSSQGIADQLQIDLQNVPAPQPGKSYYVWLLGDRHPEPVPDEIGTPRPVQPPLLITNNLPVQNGNVHYFYQGDAQHNNLISATSRLLITEEASGGHPTVPSTNRTTWRYYAEIPQGPIPNGGEGFSALVHIRHLFYNETNIKALGLPGGLDIWLFRNTEKVVESTAAARSDWHGANTSASDIGLMRALLLRIIDYLDGAPNVQVDVPPGTTYSADPYLTKVAMLTVSPRQSSDLAADPPGYVDHIQLHVGQVAKATDIPPEMRQLTARILDNIGRAKGWLQNVRKDVLQLIKIMNDPAQIRQASTGDLLNDMTTQALFAYIGELDPNTNQVKGGVLQAHYAMEQLGTLTITNKLPQSL